MARKKTNETIYPAVKHYLAITRMNKYYYLGYLDLAFPLCYEVERG